MSENLRLKPLRDTLCNIIFGDDKYKKYIVPLQGNWYNPASEKGSHGTWIGYVIDYTDYSSSAISQGGRLIRSGKSQIHLTFIGPDAEDYAHGVTFWPFRADVTAEFAKYNGVLNNKDIRVFTSLYMQDGVASTLCYNVNLTVMYNEKLNISSPVLKKVDLHGDLIVK